MKTTRRVVSVGEKGRSVSEAGNGAARDRASIDRKSSSPGRIAREDKRREKGSEIATRSWITSVIVGRKRVDGRRVKVDEEVAGRNGGRRSRGRPCLSLIFRGIRLRPRPFLHSRSSRLPVCSRASSFNRKWPITGHLIVRENNRITRSLANRIKIERAARRARELHSDRAAVCLTVVTDKKRKLKRRPARLIVLEIYRGAVEPCRSGKLPSQPCFHASPGFQARTIARHVARNHT